MAIQEKELGQSRPSDTTATSLYSPATGVTAVIRNIFVCETSGTNRTFRIFCDKDGTTYDQTTALYYDVAITANTTTQLTTYIVLNNSSGNLAVRTSSGSALTFTAYGAEITV